MPRNRSIETDLCVIGAGAAGIALARELSGARFRVALLESGGFEPDPDTQALYRGQVYGRHYFTLDACRTRQFGGSTNCWQGLCRPLEPIDFELRDWVPHSGWPFDAEALRPYYVRAQEVLRLGSFRYAGSDWASPGLAPLPFEGDAIQTRVFQVAPLRLGEIYRDEIANAPNVDSYLFANVVKIETWPARGSVRSVRVACLDGNTFAVRARVFVLATGGIENARMLLASDVGNPHDNVGRYFMEHPHVMAGAFLPSNAELPLGFYRGHPVGPATIAGYLSATDALQRSERLLGFCSFLAQEAPLPEFEQALSRVVLAMDQAAGRPADRAVFFMNEVEQAPNPNSRVRLGEERDALGMRRVRLEWRLSSIDKRSIRRAHVILGRELGRAGLGRLQLMLSDDEYQWPAEMAGGRHHMGTTRMHRDPKLGVVDPDCRVHGIENLYVAGSSVFPTAGAANPTLTLVALALRLADHLKEGMA